KEAINTRDPESGRIVPNRKVLKRMKLIPNLAAIDRKAIDVLGIPGLDLMEAAGAEVYRAVRALVDKDRKAKIVIVCGAGNNGGDGYVCARRLAEKGYERVTVVQAAPVSESAQDAAISYARLAG